MVGLFVARTCNPKREPQSLPCHNLPAIDNSLIGDVTMKNLTQKKLKELLHYNQENGVFTWRKTRGGAFKNQLKGAVAGSLTPRGYVNIVVCGKQYKAHRLAWLYVHGYFSEHSMDHMNRIRNDNRIENLREASRMCNSQNCKLSRNNTSGFNGVSYRREEEKWMAYIKLKGKHHYLGLYQSPLEAALARITAEDCLPDWKCDHNSESRRKAFSQLNRQEKS